MLVWKIDIGNWYWKLDNQSDLLDKIALGLR